MRGAPTSSPTSPLHLPYISASYISPTSPLHLPYISPTSRLVTTSSSSARRRSAERPGRRAAKPPWRGCGTACRARTPRVAGSRRCLATRCLRSHAHATHTPRTRHAFAHAMHLCTWRPGAASRAARACRLARAAAAAHPRLPGWRGRRSGGGARVAPPPLAPPTRPLVRRARAAAVGAAQVRVS